MLGPVAHSDASLLAEVLVLRQENAVLRRQVGRVRHEPTDRAWFAALSALRGCLVPRRMGFSTSTAVDVAHMLVLMNAAQPANPAHTAEPAHRRDAAATREAILAAAVVEFTEHGYTRAGVRQVAERAGVTAMMINRYFGSKRGLFAEAVDRSFGPATVVGSERRGLTRDMARALAARTGPGAEGLDPFLLMLRCASDPEALQTVRQGIEAHAGARLAGLIGGAEADVRAQLGLALVAGTWLLRVVIGTRALAAADDDRLADLLTAMLEPITQQADAANVHDAGGASVPRR